MRCPAALIRRLQTFSSYTQSLTSSVGLLVRLAPRCSLTPLNAFEVLKCRPGHGFRGSVASALSSLELRLKLCPWQIRTHGLLSSEAELASLSVGTRDDLIQQVLDGVKSFRRDVAPKRPSDGEPVPEAEGMDNAILLDAQRPEFQGAESGQLSEACRLLQWAMADASFSPEKLGRSIEEFKSCGGTAVRASAPAQVLLKRAIFQMNLWSWRDKLREERKELKRATEQMLHMERVDQEHTKQFPGRPMPKEDVEKIVQARNLLGRKVRQGQSFRQQLHYEMAEAEAVLRRSLRSAAGQQQLSLQEQNARFDPRRTLTVGKQKGWWSVDGAVVHHSFAKGKGITSYTTDCAWQHSSSHGMFKVVEELNLASICDVVHKSRFCEANKSWHAWMCGLSYSCVRTSYLNFGELLFADEEGKDVRFQTKDGAATAHSAVLRAVSQPFRQMLSAEMSEGRTKTIELSDVTRADLLFFLRLLYTGQVDEADWDGLSGTPHFQVTAPEDAEPASAALLNGIYTAPNHRKLTAVGASFASKAEDMVHARARIAVHSSVNFCQSTIHLSMARLCALGVWLWFRGAVAQQPDLDLGALFEGLGAIQNTGKGGKGAARADDACPAGQSPDQHSRMMANGCGPQGLVIKEPHGLFRCCNGHDVCFSVCGTSHDFCEDQFSKCMQEVCQSPLSGEHQECQKQAHSFSSMTKIFGSGFHKASQQDSCHCVPEDEALCLRVLSPMSSIAKAF
eukprot:s167_g25.t1